MVRRNLRFFARSHAAVALGVAAATAALTGALLVGDSMRGSLRETAVERLGRIDSAVVSAHFFRDELALSVAASSAAEIAPVLLLRGSATHAATQARAGSVTVLGVDDRFWAMQAGGTELEFERPQGREVVLNEPLALELGAAPGDEILIRLGKPSAVSTETLLGRRDDTTLSIRLTVRAVVPANGLGAFAVQPRQSVPANAYLPMATLQRAVDRAGRANVLLLAGGADHAAAVQSSFGLADLGLRLRLDEKQGYVALESERFLIEPVFEDAARSAAAEADLSVAAVLTYLANEISIANHDGPSAGETPASPKTPMFRSVPYSTVAGIDSRGLAALDIPIALQPGELLLNDWAAAELGASVGDRVRLAYYVTGPFGSLETQHAEFILRGFVSLRGPAADPGFTPTYPGVTDSKRISDWDPPFPVDLSKVRDKDEAYWDQHRATPKAFVTLADAAKHWAHEPERHGRLTSIRLYPPAGGAVGDAAAEFQRRFLQRMDPVECGLGVEPIRARAVAASQGNTDFGGLFIGFSFFLILAALMLVVLLFRLGIERRAGEIGLLLAVGHTPRQVAGVLFCEGTAVACIGVALGVVGALGYGWLMLAGLRTLWVAAVSAPFLRLHVSGLSLVLGCGVSLTAAVASMAWAVRGLTGHSARGLLAGVVGSKPSPRGGRRGLAVGLAGFLTAAVAGALGLAGDALPQAGAFFLSGAGMLVGGLGLAARTLASPPRRTLGSPGHRSLVLLGVRNAPRHRGRSVLTMALVASSAFVILALETFRLEPTTNDSERHSGTGGFSLLAESAAPLHYDLSTARGRESLNMASASDSDWTSTAVVPFRLRAGDETSCLNLYQSGKPRILGAPESMLERGGFEFAAILADNDEDRTNPWRLLGRKFADGAIAAIGDEAAVKWQLHLGLGRDLVTADEGGHAARLRFVALLKGSALQSEIVVHEDDFKRLFPSLEGFSFFLIETRPQAAAAMEQRLERELSAFGFDASPVRNRLAGYLAVQNTYLSTFQMLGGLGLMLGVMGLAAVMLRNVWERRRELALMRAVGFSSPALGMVVLAENMVLVAAGLAIGLVSAAAAVAPPLVTRAHDLPWLSLLALIIGVLATGLIAGAAALASTLRAPLVASLRSE